MPDYSRQKCIILKCPNNGRKTVPYCAACAGGMAYALRQDNPMAWVEGRQDRLTKFQARMVYLGAKDKTYAKAERIIKRARQERFRKPPLDARENR